MNCFYKLISKEGFSIIDFAFIGNLNLLIVSAIWCWCAGDHPIKDIPWHAKGYFLNTIVFGNTRFVV